MGGGKKWPGQRAAKLLEANKRAAVSFGVDIGKALIGLFRFADLHQKGETKRRPFLVPSIVRGQFGEAPRFLAPGKFNWQAESGATREERIGVYRNEKHDFAVMVH